MLKAEWTKQLQNYLLCVLVFCIPFSFSLISISIILLCLAWLLKGDFKGTWENLKRRKVLWPFIIFYLLHAISYFYSTDKAQSAFDLEEKLSLIILPIVIGAGMNIKEELAERVFFSFASGISALALFCLGRAVFTFLVHHTSSQFYYHELVFGFDANAVYVSWYAIFSLLLLLFFPWDKFFNGRSKYLQTFYIIIQLCFLVLLASKTLIALFFLLLVLYGAPRFLNFKKLGFKELAVLIIGAAIVAVLVFTDNPVKQRYTDVLKHDLNNANASDSSVSKNSGNLTLRLFLWRLGMENVREHNLWWYGAGNGDVSLLQNAKLDQHGIGNIYTEEGRSNLYNVNLHNMYLESLIMIGLPGLLCLLIIVFSPFLYYKNNKYRPLYMPFCTISAIFLFQEAALQTEAGIVYYILFMQIFISVYYSNTHLEKH